MKKIVFITVQSWHTKRLGGFHKFAEASCEHGIETVFFSFPRPYYGFFMKNELYNRKSIKALIKGIDYQVGNSILHNITIPTLRFPNSFDRFLGERMMNTLLKFSFSSFKRFAKKWFLGTDVFVFESADGIVFIDKLKKMFPQAKFVYRPSDVMMYDGALPRFANLEEHIMKEVDLNLFVHPGYEQFYSSKISDFYETIKFKTISNGVDIEPFEKKYEIPEELKKNNTALYIGAWKVDWELIFKVAEIKQNFNFIIICPNQPENTTLERIKGYSNVIYIPGILPKEIPMWLTNCDVFIIPYEKGVRTNRGFGITAKYYQAMAAKKPIVAYNEIPQVAEVGIPVVHTTEDFIAELEKAMLSPVVAYNFDLESKRWSNLKKVFVETLENLCN